TPGVMVTPAQAGATLSTAEIVDLLRPSVVHVLTETATIGVFGQVVPQQGVGTGFIIDEEGHIVTNNHVITLNDDQPVEDITVTLDDGRKFPARIVGRDRPTDLAVLKIDAEGLTPATLGDSSQLRVGDEVVAIGNALNLPGGPTVTKGVISAKDRLIQSGAISIPDAIQTDAAINPGNSGGPLVNMRGEVGGITTAVIRASDAQGVGLVIAIDTAKPIVAELMESGLVERGFLGVGIVSVTASLAESFGLAVDHGVALQEVQPNGPAAEAGLETGDVIVTVEGQDVETSGDLLAVLSEYREGVTVEVGFYRGDDMKSAEVTLD
ncbi:MAG: S1C family serine protease, partial [Dehalococcoidia bacterium]